MRRPSILRPAGVSAAALSALAVTAMADTPRPDLAHGDVMGMSAVTLRWATYTGADDCPEIGPNSAVQWLRAFATPDQRRRLENNPDLDDELRILANNTPGYSDLCTSPAPRLATGKNYPKPPTVRGSKAYGLNLDGTSDGRATANTCAHRKFDGLSGEDGVDNELYRVLGCQRNYRWEKRTGEAVDNVFDFERSSWGSKEYVTGEQITLLQITGVDDRRNDPEVDILLASGEGSPIVGQDSRPLSWVTQTVGADPRWQASVKGRIENGILHSQTFDFRIKRRQGRATGDYEMLGARMRLTLTPNGGAKGVIGGYFPIEPLYWHRPATLGGGMSRQNQHNCAGWYKTVADAADGYPDPETGQCTAISGALAVEFTPAFVRMPKAIRTTTASK